jgi:hypothetical protein
MCGRAVRDRSRGGAGSRCLSRFLPLRLGHRCGPRWRGGSPLAVCFVANEGHVRLGNGQYLPGRPSGGDTLSGWLLWRRVSCGCPAGGRTSCARLLWRCGWRGCPARGCLTGTGARGRSGHRPCALPPAPARSFRVAAGGPAPGQPVRRHCLTFSDDTDRGARISGILPQPGSARPSGMGEAVSWKRPASGPSWRLCGYLCCLSKDTSESRRTTQRHHGRSRAAGGARFTRHRGHRAGRGYRRRGDRG